MRSKMTEVGRIEKGFSVVVENVTKKFFRAKNNIINGLCMRVPQGAMYGLLGPSGCGKTTLLKCILGQLDIDSGIIQISATKWKHIGYMPQDVSLHEELLIKELFMFYKIIYGIPDYIFHKIIEEFAKLFELPSLDKFVHMCSGGQKRRISLAVTLLHDPDILVLDEPTVGLDPLLSHKIMKYLKCLSVEKDKTILITTHYMEEARPLNLVGLMRHGVLLAEDEPEVLISRYSCESLDEVFVHVIKKASGSDEPIEDIGVSRDKETCKSRPWLGSDKVFDLSHLFALLYKDYKFAIRNLHITLVALFLPVIIIIIYMTGLATLETPNGIGYYNEELVDATSCLMNDTVVAEMCPPSSYYSCDFLSIIDQKILLKKYDSIDEGLESLRRADIYAMLYFPSNFSNSIADRMTFRLDDEALNGDKQMNVWFDNSLFFNAFKTKIDIYETLLELVEKKCRECGIDPRLARTMSNIRLEFVYGNVKNHLSSWLPSIIIGALSYLSYFYTAAKLMAEKQSGVLERDQMNGISSGEMLVSTLANAFIVMNIQTISALILVHGYFGERMLGSYFLGYGVIMISSYIGSLYGVLMVLFTDRSLFVMFCGLNFYFTTVFLNGALWPIEGIHWLIKLFVRWIPTVETTLVYRHIMQHGFGLLHHLVYPGIIYAVLSNAALILCIYSKIRYSNWKL